MSRWSEGELQDWVGSSPHQLGKSYPKRDQSGQGVLQQVTDDLTPRHCLADER